jgi:hypothetical protein
LKLHYRKLLSDSAFDFNMRRYNWVSRHRAKCAEARRAREASGTN